MHTWPQEVVVLTIEDLERMGSQRPVPAGPADRCLRCGNPTAYHVFGPVNGMMLVTEYHRARGEFVTRRELANRGTPPNLGAHVPLTDICLACLLKTERDTARDVRQAVVGTDPRDDAWYIQCLPGHEIGDRWQDYSLLIFGRRVGRVVSEPMKPAPTGRATDRRPAAIDTRRVPWAGHYWRDRENVVVIQAWLRRVRYKDTPLCVEERWCPGMPEAKRALLGLEGDESPRHRQAALRGEQLLAELDRAGWARFQDADECKAAVETWVLNALRTGRELRRADAEHELCYVRSEGRQLGRYLEPYRWTEIVQEVKRRHPDLLS